MTAENLSRSEHTAGSPDLGEPVFLAVGRLRRPHGVQGEILMDVLTDFPERLQPGVLVFIGEEHLPKSILSFRQHNKGVLVTFDGYNDRESIGQFRNMMVYVHTDNIPALPDGEYYHHQLLGIKVLTDDNRVLGKVSNILETGANDVYIVETDIGPDILLPAIDSVVLEINLNRNEMIVHLLPGLEP